MSGKHCKLHFGGSATSCGGKPCKKCVPFLTFNVTLILLAGGLIGLSGLVLVEDTPAAQLLRDTTVQISNIKAIENQLTALNYTMEQIKSDVKKLKQQVNMD